MRSSRFLIVAPTFLEWDLGTYVQNLLGARGIECGTFEYWPFPSSEEASRELLREVRRFRPDVVFGLKLQKILPDAIRAIRKRGVLCLLWHVDCDDPRPPAWIKSLVRECDVFLTTAKGMVSRYQPLSRNPVHWIYEGVYLPGFPLRRPGAGRVPDVYRSEVAFAGNIYYPSSHSRLANDRHDLLRQIQRKYELKVWGPQGDPRASEKWGESYPAIEWPAYHEELVNICRGAAIVVGTNRINDIELYFSNRTFLTLAAGGFHLTRYVPGLETMFENHKHLAWFHSNGECLELIDYYLGRPALRRRISKQGQQWVRRRYGMAKQINRILKIIERHNEGR